MKRARNFALGKGLLLSLPVCIMGACSPALNWRAVPVPDAGLQVLLPCKPEQVIRTVELAGASLPVTMVGCEADGATFAVSYVRLGDPSRVAQTIAHWQAATLARLGAATEAGLAPARQPFEPHGALTIPQSQRISMPTRAIDGSSISAQWVWFARAVGSDVWVYHGAVLSTRPHVAAADAFFAGMELR